MMLVISAPAAGPAGRHLFGRMPLLEPSAALWELFMAIPLRCAAAAWPFCAVCTLGMTLQWIDAVHRPGMPPQ